MCTIHHCCISDLMRIRILRFVYEQGVTMAGGVHNHVAWARSDTAQCYYKLSCICIGTRHHRVETLTDFLQLFRGYSVVLKKGGLLFIFTIEGLLYLSCIDWKLHTWRCEITCKNKKCLSGFSSVKALIITKEEKAGGKLRRSAGGQHNASFELRGKDSCSINTLLFIFLERVWDGKFKGWDSAQFSLSKTRIPRPAHIAKCYSPFHKTWIYHFCCFCCRKNILNAE